MVTLVIVHLLPWPVRVPKSRDLVCLVHTVRCAGPGTHKCSMNTGISQEVAGSRWPPEDSYVALCSLTLLSLRAQVVNLSLQLSMSRVKLQGTTSVLG